MSRKTLGKLGVLLFLALLLAGTLAIDGCARKPTAADIVAKVQEVMTSTHDVHAVIELAANVQGESVQAVIEAWGKQPNKAHIKVMETDRDEFDGLVGVTDGQTAWFYTPSENQVIVADISELTDPTPQAIISDLESFIQSVLDASDVELIGEEEIAGAKTYKLILTPKEDEEQPLPITGTATLWVDKEQWIVLKAHLVAPNIGEGTMLVRSFELNPGLDDETFTFEVPEGVTVINAEDEQAQHMTLDEAEAQAGFDLLTPDYLPDGATLVDVLEAKGAFVLLYHLEGASFTVVQSQDELPSEMPTAGELVTVRGVQATLFSDETLGASFLTWHENGVHFAVTGRIDGDEAIKIAASLR
jgi:outer membrane lipoprotein-sorting protein